MRFTIRFSILTIILSLLIGTSLVLFIVYQYVINRLLIESAQSSLRYVSIKIDTEAGKYFLPLDQLSLLGAGLIQDNSITPGNTPEFISFLYNLVAIKRDIRTVFFADVQGSLYVVGQSDDDIHFDYQSIIRTDQGSKKVENNYLARPQVNAVHYLGKIQYIGSRPVVKSSFDPRKTIWYQLTKLNKKHTWAVYLSSVIRNGFPERVIGSLYPIYNSKGELLGIFGADIPLQYIYDFIKTIKVSANSVIFICNQEGMLLEDVDEDNTKNDQAHHLSDLKMPWIEQSFNLYLKNNQPIFVFNFKGKKYIAAYNDMSPTDNIPQLIKGSYQWKIGVVIPVSDITASFQKSILYVLAAFMLILTIGIIFATAFASNLSQPMVKLANDAELICKFKLDQIKGIVSRIKEISLVGSAFIKMRVALGSFQKYMPATLVKKLILSGKIAEVGGENKKLTLLFSDIENFTAISEKISPSDLMHYLSEYFEVATRIIINNSGTVDKYIGDGILAFWGAPLDDAEHPLNAARAALEIYEDLQKLNASWRLQGLPEFITRIGINTAEVVVGNVGSHDRLNYTVIGDGVNLASRLELLNKTYGTHILVSEFTYNLIKEHFKFRLVDKVKVKGKTAGVYVYELLNHDNIQLEYNSLFSSAFVKYEQGAWQEALEIFKSLAEQDPNDQLVKVFIERCELFSHTPPSSWDGSWVMLTK